MKNVKNDIKNVNEHIKKIPTLKNNFRFTNCSQIINGNPVGKLLRPLRANLSQIVRISSIVFRICSVESRPPSRNDVCV